MGVPKNAGWFIEGKILLNNTDDNWGCPYALGHLHLGTLGSLDMGDLKQHLKDYQRLHIWDLCRSHTTGIFRGFEAWPKASASEKNPGPLGRLGRLGQGAKNEPCSAFLRAPETWTDLVACGGLGGLGFSSSMDWFCWENQQETMVFTIKYRGFL